MQRSFSAIPDAPQTQNQWEAMFWQAIKQNLELLCALRGTSHAALLLGDLTGIPYVNDYGAAGDHQRIYGIDPGMTMVVDYGDVPTLGDYTKLVYEVKALREAFNTLLSRVG